MDRPSLLLKAGFVLAVVLGLTSPTIAHATSPAERVATAVEDVSGATAHRFGAHDSAGATLDGLKVIQSWPQYVGVYHSPGGNSFDLHVATSSDLMGWTRRTTLDTDASQGTIAALPGGGFLVVYEKALTADVAPLLKLPSELAVVSGLIGRVRLRFRYYPSLTSLLAGKHAREFTAPRTVAMTAEGTPDIQGVAWAGPGASRLELGLHHFADTDGDGFPDADRQGTGVLTNFQTWRDAKAPAIDEAFLNMTDLHDGFDSAPTGNIGDRDTIDLDGARLALHEAQYRVGEFATWRLFLRDVDNGTLRPLTPNIASTAFGNPTVTALTLPDGRPALFVSAFVFSEGAAPTQAGSLILYKAGV